jgi:hypothetical protein
MVGFICSRCQRLFRSLEKNAMKIKYLFNAVPVVLLMPLMCFVAFGAELPSDVQRLFEQRNNAIQKIDVKFTEELDKLKVKYTKAGDLESANAILDLIKTINSKDHGGNHGGDSKESVAVASPGEYSVNVLDVGVNRLNGYNVPFDWVSNEIKDWEFTRVKWKSKDLKTVTFLKNGEIYVTKLESFETSSNTVKKISVAGKAKGPWLGDDDKWYRVTGEKGDTFQCGGYECLIVAKSFKKN